MKMDIIKHNLLTYCIALKHINEKYISNMSLIL